MDLRSAAGVGWIYGRLGGRLHMLRGLRLHAAALQQRIGKKIPEHWDLTVLEALVHPLGEIVINAVVVEKATYFDERVRIVEQRLQNSAAVHRRRQEALRPQDRLHG